MTRNASLILAGFFSWVTATIDAVICAVAAMVALVISTCALEGPGSMALLASGFMRDARLPHSSRTTAYRRNVRARHGDGEEGDRTLDLCIANAALSQLSYFPEAVGY